MMGCDDFYLIFVFVFKAKEQTLWMIVFCVLNRAGENCVIPACFPVRGLSSEDQDQLRRRLCLYEYRIKYMVIFY